MEIKGQKGFTAIVDAMIFIALMTLVVSVMYNADSLDNEDIQDASDILPMLLESEVEIDTVDGIFKVKMHDGLVCTMYADCGADTAASNILDSHFMREGAYRLTIEHNGLSYSIGSGEGVPTSSYSEDIFSEFYTAKYTLALY